MRRLARRSVRSVVMILMALSVQWPARTWAQQAAAVSPPTLIAVDGTVPPAAGAAPRVEVLLVLSLYAGQADAEPVWREYQIVPVDAQGRYAVSAGAMQGAGIPPEVFAAGGAQWFGVGVEGEAEQPRIRLVSVPYAARAVSADTLGGRPASEFVLVENLSAKARAALDDGTVRGASDDVLTQATTTNFLAKFENSGGTLTDSTVVETGGKVGMGTTSPLGRLDVVANQTDVNLTWTGGTEYGRFLFREGADVRGIVQVLGSAFGTTARQNDLEISSVLGNVTLQGPGGRVGIGTQDPFGTLDISASTTDANLIWTSATQYGRFLFREGTSVRGAVQMLGSSFETTARRGDLEINSESGDVNLQTGGGNVGLGTNSPTSKLHVVGNALVTGNVVVDGNLAAKYQDVAEWVPAVEPLPPGTVVVVDPARDNAVVRSTAAYAKSVAGAVSPQPGLILGEPGPNKVLVAQSGRVRIKADARYGAIKRGDLLVTSPRAGYAMRSNPVRMGKTSMHRPGTVLGKALQSLPAGQGEILVLLTLQ